MSIPATLALACLLLASMVQAQEVVLDQDELSPEETLVTVDLFRFEPNLDVSQPPRKKLSGKVTFGRWVIAPLCRNESPPKGLEECPGGDLYLVRFPFSLHQPSAPLEARELVVEVELDDPETSAFDLFPLEILTVPAAPPVLVVGREDFTFRLVNRRDAAQGLSFVLPGLQPVVQAFGTGEEAFYWHFQPGAADGVSPGVRHAFVILQVIPEMTRLGVTLAGTVELAERLPFSLGWRNKTAYSETVKLAVDLVTGRSRVVDRKAPEPPPEDGAKEDAR